MCALLAQIFPVILLTLAIESGRVGVKLRRRKWWSEWIVLSSVTCSLAGLGVAIVSTAMRGAGSYMGVLLWALLALSVTGMAMLLLAILATDELEAECHDAVESDADREDRLFLQNLSRPAQ